MPQGVRFRAVNLMVRGSLGDPVDGFDEGVFGNVDMHCFVCTLHYSTALRWRVCVHAPRGTRLRR